MSKRLVVLTRAVDWALLVVGVVLLGVVLWQQEWIVLPYPIVFILLAVRGFYLFKYHRPDN